MPTDAISLALFVIEEGIKVEPAIAAELRSLFSKGKPTEEDWIALRARVATKTYKDFVPTTVLPDSEATV